MSDPDPRLDDILSAHLDGEATAVQGARIESDPALTARLAELAAVRDAIRADPPTVDDVTRERTLAAVFATLDRDTPSETPLTPIAQLPKRRRDPSRILGIAAAVIAVALLGGAVTMLARESGSGGESSGGDSAATELATSAAPSTDADSEGGAFDESSADPQEQHSTAAADVPPGPTQFLRAAGVPLIGSFADETQLTITVQQQLLKPQREAPQAGATPGSAPPLTPAAEGSDCPAPAGTRAAYVGELEGRPVFIVVIDGPVGVVLDQQDCTEVLRITQQ